MDSINRKEIENYKARRIKTVKGATINRDLSCLRKLFNNAIADSIVDINPLSNIEFFKEIQKSANFLSEGQAKLLIASCDSEPAKTFIIFGLNTGMRYNELLSLKWEQINIEDRLITLKDTKNNKEDTIPLNATIMNYISELNRKGDFVICKKDGSQYYDFRKQWNRAIKRAGLFKCTPHILRHSWATMLVRAGVDLVTLKDLGRWSDLKLVERYSHVANDHRSRMVERLDSIFRTDTKSDTVDEQEK
jgi:site-specific recombinase XerD